MPLTGREVVLYEKHEHVVHGHCASGKKAAELRRGASYAGTSAYSVAAVTRCY